MTLRAALIETERAQLGVYRRGLFSEIEKISAGAGDWKRAKELRAKIHDCETRIKELSQ